MVVLRLHAALFVCFDVLAFCKSISFRFLGALSVRGLVVSITLSSCIKQKEERLTVIKDRAAILANETYTHMIFLSQDRLPRGPQGRARIGKPRAVGNRVMGNI